VLPEDKADEIDEIQSDRSRAIIVDDGVNDSSTLITVHVGVAIISGTDVAIRSGDIALICDNSIDVIKAMRIGDATISKMC